MRNKENKVKCKMGIGKELFIFLPGGPSWSNRTSCIPLYQLLREVVHHAHWVIELEDLIYWIGTAIFLFVQIYYTSSGIVRWYFILGVGIGGIIMSVFLAITGKICRKIVRRHSRFFTETLEKPGEKR